MKVCLVAWDYPTQYSTAGSGIGSVTYTLAHELHRLGCQVHVVVLHAEGMPADFVDNGVIVHQVGYSSIHYYVSRLPLVGRQASLIQFIRYLEIMRAIDRRIIDLLESDGVDIVEIPNAHNPFWFLSRKLRQVPYIAWIHGSPYLFKAMLDVRLDWIDRLQEKMARHFMRNAEVVVSPSVFLGDFYRDRVGPHVKVVPSPAPITYFETHGPQQSGSANPKDGSLTVLAASPLSWAKGVDTLMEAIPLVLQRQPATQFILAGKEDTYTAGTLMQYFRDRGLEDSVRLPGHVPWNQMSTYHQRADVFVIATRWENSPLSVIEAMAAGKPVVGTAVGGIPELILDGETGLLVPPDDPVALADALTTLLQDRELRERLGQNGRERIRRLHCPTEIAQQRMRLYASAVLSS